MPRHTATGIVASVPIGKGVLLTEQSVVKPTKKSEIFCFFVAGMFIWSIKSPVYVRTNHSLVCQPKSRPTHSAPDWPANAGRYGTHGWQKGREQTYYGNFSSSEIFPEDEHGLGLKRRAH